MPLISSLSSAANLSLSSSLVSLCLPGWKEIFNEQFKLTGNHCYITNQINRVHMVVDIKVGIVFPHSEALWWLYYLLMKSRKDWSHLCEFLDNLPWKRIQCKKRSVNMQARTQFFALSLSLALSLSKGSWLSWLTNYCKTLRARKRPELTIPRLMVNHTSLSALCSLPRSPWHTWCQGIWQACPILCLA